MRSGKVPPLKVWTGAGVLLITGSLVFLLTVAACFVVAAGLMQDRNLSEFGIDPRTAAIFNGALVVVGLMTLAAAWRWSGRLAWLIALSCVLSGVGMIGAGGVTIEVARLPHAILSGIGYAGHLLLPLALAPSLSGRIKVAAFGAVGLSIAFLLLWALAPALLIATIGQGTGQFLTTIPLLLWIAAFVGHRYRSRWHGIVMPQRGHLRLAQADLRLWQGHRHHPS